LTIVKRENFKRGLSLSKVTSLLFIFVFYKRADEIPLAKKEAPLNPLSAIVKTYLELKLCSR
jgi:hypothetical protein